MSVNVRIRNGMEPDGGSGGASEGDIRGAISDILYVDATQGGVADKTNGHLLVHEASVPAMTVVLDKGVGYIPNTAFDETDSDSIKAWEAVVSGSVSSRTVTISANSSGQPRVDLIVIKLDPGITPDKNASDIAIPFVVEGTPGSGMPVVPAYCLLLLN